MTDILRKKISKLNIFHKTTSGYCRRDISQDDYSDYIWILQACTNLEPIEDDIHKFQQQSPKQNPENSIQLRAWRKTQ